MISHDTLSPKFQDHLSIYFSLTKTKGNRSQYTVIGSRLKKQKIEKNYGILFNASIVAKFIEKTVNCEPTTVNGYDKRFNDRNISKSEIVCKEKRLEPTIP